MPPLVKAKKAGTIKKLKSSLKRGGGGAFIKNVPKDSGITVRFLTEPTEWVEYQEYYSEDMEPRFFPAFEGLDPDVVADLKKPSKRYLACGVDRESNEVIALKMPKSLVESLMKKYDKYETIMDRDYELVRDGDGLDTTYEAIPEAPKKMNVAKFEPLDLLNVLEAQIPASLKGEDEDDDDDDDDTPPWEDDDKPVRRKRPVKKRPSSSATAARRSSGGSRNGGGIKKRRRLGK